MRFHKIALYIMASVATCAAIAPERCCAQEAQEEAVEIDRPKKYYEKDVLVRNSGAATQQLRQRIASLASRRLARTNEDERYNNLSFQLVSQDASISETAEICILRIRWTDNNSERDSQFAGELWEIARKEMEAALRTFQQKAYESKVAERIEQLRLLEQQRHDIEQTMEEATTQLEREMVLSNGPQEQLEHEAAEAMAQRRQLALEQVGVEARREAIERRIDELRERAVIGTRDDPVIKELQTLVEIQHQRLATFRLSSREILECQEQILQLSGMMKKIKSALADWESDPGYTRVQRQLTQEQNRLTELEAAIKVAPESDFLDSSGYREAKADLVEARIALLKAQRAAEEQVNGGVIHDLNNELSKLVVQAAEIEAKQKSLDKIYEEIRDNLRDSIRYSVERAGLEARLQTLRTRLGRIEDSYAELQSQPVDDGGEITIQPLEQALLGDEP